MEPLNQGGDSLQDAAIVQIAEDVSRTPAQVILRWHLQQNRIVIPKSVTPARIIENLHVFDFELSDDQMKSIHELNRNERQGFAPNDMNKR